MKRIGPKPVVLSCLAAIVLAVLATCSLGCSSTPNPDPWQDVEWMEQAE